MPFGCKYEENKTPVSNLFVPTEEEFAQYIATILRENPTMADTERNGGLLIQCIRDNAGENMTLGNFRAAAAVLRDQLDRKPVPPPPPKPEPKPVEILEPWQIPLFPMPSEKQLRAASVEAIKDYLRRARATR